MSEKKYSPEEVEKIKTRILESLEQVIDPELGIDIVNLGLIYEIRFDETTGETEIDMTLTTMGCPLADLLTDQIYDAMSRGYQDRCQIGLVSRLDSGKDESLCSNRFGD
mgnify:CR=1 FL=1